MGLKDKKVLVTGGSGFLGRVILAKLEDRGAEVIAPRAKEYNLIKYEDAINCIRTHKPDVVIHSAAHYGGIAINQKHPAQIYFRNMSMGLNVIEASHQCGTVEKFVGVGTACSYPGYLEGKLKEEDLWTGPCHESVRCYGAVKKMMQIQCEAYKKQYGLKGIHVMLANLYGPWDSYNPDRSHVVAALIRKFVEAKKDNSPNVDVWGSGNPIREFLYVEDAAEGILRATEAYDDTFPLNIGTGKGTSIAELALMIGRASKYEGRITFDKSMPDGQLLKIFNIERMKESLDWEPEYSLEEGLKITVEWFEEMYDEAIKRW